MTDREKVIKHIMDYINAVDGLTNVQWVLAELDVLKDAIALLKAQEPVEPKRETRGCGFRWFCGNCGINIEPNHMYCRICGRAVKWE